VEKKIPWFTVAFVFWFFFVLYVSGLFGGGHEGAGVFEDVSNLMQETDTVSRWSYLCTQFNVLIIYIRLLFLPVGQNLDYMYSFKTGFFDGYTPLAFLFLMGVVGIGIWSIRKRPVIAFAIFWFFITLSVESSIIPIRDALFEHRLYIAMVGLAVLVPHLIFYFLFTRRMAAFAICVLIISSLGTTTFLRNHLWQDRITLWSDVVSKSSRNSRGWNNWGNALAKVDQPTEAIEKFQIAINIKPDFTNAWDNWGCALSKLGKTEEAIRKHKQSLTVKPTHAPAWYNWGYALIEAGKVDEAVPKLQQAISIDPDYGKPRINLGAIYMTLLIYSDFENQNTPCCVMLKHYTQYIVPIFLRS